MLPLSGSFEINLISETLRCAIIMKTSPKNVLLQVTY